MAIYVVGYAGHEFHTSLSRYMLHPDLRKIDLNLLVVLDVLLREKSTVRAANALAKTQSAVSHSLSRLREIFQDPLLVRVGGKLVPTNLGDKLSEELERTLGGVRRLFQSRRPEDSSTRHFVVMAPDVLWSLFAKMQSALQHRYPDSSIEWVNLKPSQFSDLQEGQVDLLIAPTVARVPDGIFGQSIQPFTFASFCRKRHPALREWHAEAWRKWPHVMVRIGHERWNPVADGITNEGKNRRIAAVVPNFSTLTLMLSKSDLIATMPSVCMAEVMGPLGIVAKPSIAKVTPMPHMVYRSANGRGDGAIDWLAHECLAQMASLQGCA